MEMWLRPAMIVLAAVSLTTRLARAQNPTATADDLRRGVARISFLNGDVSIQRGDSGEWVAAAVNAPLMANDRISTGINSRMEVQFDSGGILRIGGGADVTLTGMEANRYQIAVGRGMMTFRVLRASSSDIEVDTPNVSVRPSKIGSYRISVSDTEESQITARQGDVEVFTPRGTEWVYAGQSMLARGTAADPEFQIVQAPKADDWDRWNDSRDRPIANSPSQRYVPPGVYGAQDLDAYGNWVNVAPYGNVWQPMVPVGWAPYQSGRWVWLDWYGWTWVSYEPWGWAPYHYGRWFYASPFGWCWYPGAIGVPHYWSPALVAFFGFGGGGVAFGFGNIGWVPLAPYEVLYPWWGRAYYGNLGYFNRSVNITSVNIINTYRNARVANGFTAVSAADFRSGRLTNFLRPSAAELSQASVARGPMPVAPDRANLRFSDRQAGSVARSAPAKVFTYRGTGGTQPAVQRIPFAEQERAFGSGAAASVNRGWTRFGAPNGQSLTPNRHEAGDWQRFGEPRTAPAPQSEQPAARGWSRFGEPYGDPRQANRPAAPAEVPRGPAGPGNYRFNSGAGRPEPLRVAPPIMRERSGGNGSGGYRAPAPRSTPQRSGGGTRGGSGGGHRR
jgi:FecR protein